MALNRIDRMTEPPVAGSFYMVPTVLCEWNHVVRPWPVMGPSHNDADRFAFKADHYHLDPRFMSRRMLQLGRVFDQPLHSFPYMSGVELPTPVYRRMKCVIADIHYPHHSRPEIEKIQRDFAGQQCARGKGGWICPHRKASLGSVEPWDGILVCPLHGLLIDNETGRVLTPRA